MDIVEKYAKLGSGFCILGLVVQLRSIKPLKHCSKLDIVDDLGSWLSQ